MTATSSNNDKWKELTFSEAVQVNPSVGLKRGEVYPFVGMASVDGGQRAVNGVEDRVFKGSGSKFQNGDTLMARITPCLENGKIARYQPVGDQQQAHGSTEFIVLRGRTGTTTDDFAYYLTRWEEVHQYAIGQMTGTSGRQRVPVDSLDHLTVPIPPLHEQRTIAHILGTLDEKIELNRRMNETLEAMARALFKSWFVDFEPVRTKMEGQEPYLPPELWDLFPDRLVDSDLGEIPEGWEVRELGDCFKLTMGQSPPGSTYNDDGNGTPFYQGSTDFGERYPTNRRYCTDPTRLAQTEDTLVSVRAPVGTINRAWERCCIGRGVAALRHKSGSAPYTYYAIWAAQPEIAQYEHTGTVFGAIGGQQFRALSILEPHDETVAAFHRIGQDLDSRIRFNVDESRALTMQRDALLPKLISGELRGEHVKAEGKMQAHGYEFDSALTFDSVQREQVERVTEELSRRGIRVYYDHLQRRWCRICRAVLAIQLGVADSLRAGHSPRDPGSRAIQLRASGAGKPASTGPQGP